MVNEFDLKPNPSLISMIDQKTFPLANNKFFAHDPANLAYQEYKNCVDVYNRRMGGIIDFGEKMIRWQGADQTIILKESIHKTKLEKLAEKIIRELYDIPDAIVLRGELNPSVSQEFDSTDKFQVKEEKIEKGRKSKIQEEAQKRIILNTLAHGSSIHIWKSCYYLAKDELDKIDDSLLALYDDYTVMVGILLWMTPPKISKELVEKGEVIAQGYNKVDWEDEEFDEEVEEEFKEYLKSNGEEEEIDPTGFGFGSNFPVLLHELNKATFEILLMHSVPEDFSNAELEMYFNISDVYEHEYWHFCLGPTLWVNLLKVLNEVDISVADIFILFSKINYDQLANFCIAVVEDQQKAIKQLESMLEIFEE